jgi:VWFA-related protein
MVASLLLAVGGAATATEDAESPPLFGETLDVRVVNVEVVVTDRAGRRVEGLSADDFRLFVDGDEVPVSHFSEVRGGRQLEAAAGSAAEPQGAVRVPTQVLVFVDDAFSIARDRDRVLARLADDLAVLAPGDRVAVVAFDGRRVEPLLDWSGDRVAVERALAAAAERPAHGLRPLASPAIQGRSLRQAAIDPRRLGDFELQGQLDRLVSAGAAAMRAAGRPDGRRVMLLLSGGWPFDAFGILPVGTQGHDVDVRGDLIFAPLVDAANLLGYTLYPVDVPGMRGVDLISAEHATPQSALLTDELHGSLHYLAEQTGGRAMINGRRSEALRRMADDVGSYYWLGFAPAGAGDDRRHDIRVEVSGRRLAVRARDSYLDLSHATDEAMRLEGMLLFGQLAAAP